MNAVSERALENSRRASREAKRRRTGKCEGCGATTRYHGHGQGVSRYCHGCAVKRQGEMRRGMGKRQQQLLEVLGSRQMHWTEIRDALSISEAHTGVLLHQMVRDGFVERPSRGLYRRAT